MTLHFSPDFSDDDRSAQSLRPLSGWMLEQAIALDEACPGFLRLSCRTSPIWRQSFGAILAAGLLTHPALFLQRLHGRPVADDRTWADLLRQVAEVLPVLSPRELLGAGLGMVHDGYIGALKKAGTKPLSAAAYVRLLDLFTASAPMQRRRRRVLEQMSSIDEPQFEALERLDAVLVIPAVMNKVRNAAEAESLNRALTIIRACASTASDDAIRQSLTAFIAAGSRRWIRNWLEKCDSSVSALVINDPEFEVVTPANAARVAERFKNCLRSMTPRMLTGAWAAAVYEPAALVLTFVRLADDTWLLTGAWAEGNGPVSPVLRHQAREKVLSLGGGFMVPAEVPTELAALEEFADPFLFIPDLDDIQ